MKQCTEAPSLDVVSPYICWRDIWDFYSYSTSSCGVAVKVPELPHGFVQGLQCYSKWRRCFSFGSITRWACLFSTPPDSAARKISYTSTRIHQIHKKFIMFYTPYLSISLCTMGKKKKKNFPKKFHRSDQEKCLWRWMDQGMCTNPVPAVSKIPSTHGPCLQHAPGTKQPTICYLGETLSRMWWNPSDSKVMFLLNNKTLL